MNLELFKNSSSGKLLKVGQTDKAYLAFIPNPLPPELNFDTDFILKLSDADRALGELAGLGRSIPNPNLLIGPFIRREAVLSSRIEGTQADIADLYAYEASQFKDTPAKSDVKEVHNYVRALEYGLERIKTLPISLRLIRELHQHLMEGVRGEQVTPGEFRRTQNWIGPPGCTLNEATFVPPPVPEMKEALDKLEKYLHAKNKYPPLVRLAMIHYQFEAIHPFIDGNGRIGRLLITLLLVHWDLLPLPLLYLSVFFERNRQEYYDNLLAVSQNGSWREWILLFLQGTIEQAEDAIVRVKELQKIQMTWREDLTEARVSSQVLSLVDKLFESPIITIPIVQDLLNISYPTAKSYVGKLLKAGILVQIGESSYDKVFITREFFKDVKDEEDFLERIKFLGRKV